MTGKKIKRYPFINEKQCVGCGCCMKACPKQALSVPVGIFAKVDLDKCVGCGLCFKSCPASVIEMRVREESE